MAANQAIALGEDMNRDLIINILLILAGIVLAFALFGAGVLWKSQSTTGTPSSSQFLLSKPRGLWC